MTSLMTDVGTGPVEVVISNGLIQMKVMQCLMFKLSYDFRAVV